MKIHHLFILLTVSLVACTSQSASFLKKKTLKTLTNQKIALSQFTENKPFVLVFYSTDCPICQKYVPILRGVSDSFPDVKFILIFTKWDSLQATKNFARSITWDRRASSTNASNDFGYVWDYKNKLIKNLKATTTPEAFFYDINHKLQYRGAIDNWFFALGRYRPQATEHYLKNALTQYLKNEKISVSKTNPIGCLIEY